MPRHIFYQTATGQVCCKAVRCGPRPLPPEHRRVCRLHVGFTPAVHDEMAFVAQELHVTPSELLERAWRLARLELLKPSAETRVHESVYP